MRKLSLIAILSLSCVGCGEGPPPAMTPEQEAKMNAEMKTSMDNMMSSMQQPPGSPKPKAKKK